MDSSRSCCWYAPAILAEVLRVAAIQVPAAIVRASADLVYALTL
jgi:hypothetical protein